VPGRSPELLVSQKNDLLESLRAAEVDPADFTWEWGQSWYSKRQAPVLRQVGGGFHFLVDFGSSGAGLEYCPSDDRPLEQLSVEDWVMARLHAVKWARCVARELNTVDLWAELGSERELARAGENEANNEPFEREEVDRVAAVLAELRELLTATYQLTAEQTEMLDRRFGYLERASRRVGRVDWVNLLMSAFVQLVMQGVLTSDAARDALAAARHGLAGLFPELRALP
jgi:hypothetical protein